jgi:tetratricopeptide (TPR) repeat protein
MMSSISPARLALAVLLAGGVAHAQPAETPPAEPASPALVEARRLFIEGNEHYSAGRYALAAERFIKAYELSGKPALLFNLANTYERVGNYEKAAHYLRMYLNGGDVHDPAAVKARLQRLEITIIENKKNAETAGTPTPPPAPATSVTPVEPVAAVHEHRPSRVPYYVAGGAFVAGATTAVVFGLLARSERSEIDGLCSEQSGGVICPPSAEPHLTSERRDALFSDLGLGVAAASVATGLVYYLVTRDSAATEPSRQALSIVPSASGDGVGVLATGRF